MLMPLKEEGVFKNPKKHITVLEKASKPSQVLAELKGKPLIPDKTRCKLQQTLESSPKP